MSDENNTNTSVENTTNTGVENNNDVAVDNALKKSPSLNYRRITELDELATTILADMLVNLTNFHLLVSRVVERAEKFTDLTHEERIELAILSLNKTIDTLDISNDDKKNLKLSLPNMVNIFIKASNKELKLKGGKLHKTTITSPHVIADKLFERIRDFIADKNYTSENLLSNIFVITSNAMILVNQYPKLSGLEKKTLVINALLKLLDYLSEDDSKNYNKDTILRIKTFVETIVSGSIDMFVSGYKGKYNVGHRAGGGNNKMNVILSILSLCMVCLKNNNLTPYEVNDDNV